MTTLDHLGPIDYLAIEFPHGNPTPEGFAEITRQVDAGTIHVLDLEFVRRDAAGAVTTVSASTLGLDLGSLTGTDAGLLDREDLELVGAGLQADGVLLVIVYEDLALNAALTAWEAVGAQIVAEGPVHVEDLEAALADQPTDPEE